MKQQLQLLSLVLILNYAECFTDSVLDSSSSLNRFFD